MLKPQLPPPRTVHPYYNSNHIGLSSVSRTLPRQPKQLWNDRDSVYQTNVTETSSSELDFQNKYNNHRHSHDNVLKSPVYNSPYQTGTWSNNTRYQGSSFRRPDTYLFTENASTFSVPLCRDTEAYQYIEPVSRNNVLSESPHIGGCGGHCPGFEYVCYYILQIIFVVGILTGISLCIAGAVLRRNNRAGDLGVLVYIGSLWSMVCALLLGIQCCVRRELSHRKRPTPTHLPLQPVNSTMHGLN